MYWFILVLLFLVSCEKEVVKESIRPVKTIQISEASSSDREIIFPGTLRAFKRADLSFRVDGIINKRDFNVGYNAKKDEVLMQLDPREYLLALKKARGNVESIKAQLDFSTRDFERMKKIYEKDPGAISESLLDRKEEAKNRLKAELGVAQSDVDQAADNLSYTSLKAPFDGIIAAIYVENYEQVRAKQVVLRYLDVGDREMEINVPEKFINALIEGKKDLKFEVRLDAFPDKMFPAVIEEIGTEAASTTQTYPVTLSLKKVPVEMSLLAGMSGQAFLKREGVANQSYKIPKSAIFTDNGQATSVWIVNPDTQTVHKKAVTIDKGAKGNFVLVQEGLSPGDRVVIAGASFLTEGQKIRLDTP